MTDRPAYAETVFYVCDIVGDVLELEYSEDYLDDPPRVCQLHVTITPKGHPAGTTVTLNADQARAWARRLGKLFGPDGRGQLR